jgi:hypothetical protein
VLLAAVSGILRAEVDKRNGGVLFAEAVEDADFSLLPLGISAMKTVKNVTELLS